MLEPNDLKLRNMNKALTIPFNESEFTTSLFYILSSFNNLYLHVNERKTLHTYISKSPFLYTPQQNNTPKSFFKKN